MGLILSGEPIAAALAGAPAGPLVDYVGAPAMTISGLSGMLTGVTSGMLSLSRNVGLITGAAVMGAIFAFGSGTHDITRASPEAVATGMRWTFAVASLLVLLALSLAMKMRHPRSCAAE
jgi:hypothetical protein